MWLSNQQKICGNQMYTSTPSIPELIPVEINVDKSGQVFITVYTCQHLNATGACISHQYNPSVHTINGFGLLHKVIQDVSYWANKEYQQTCVPGNFQVTKMKPKKRIRDISNRGCWRHQIQLYLLKNIWEHPT